MKKFFFPSLIAALLLGSFTACGPRRLGCGPYRCEAPVKKTDTAQKNRMLAHPVVPSAEAR